MDSNSLKGKRVWRLVIEESDESALFASEDDAKQHAKNILICRTKDELFELASKQKDLEKKAKHLAELLQRIESSNSDDDEKALWDLFGYRRFFFPVLIC